MQMRLVIIALILGQASRSAAQRVSTAEATQSVIPLVGEWQLNLARTHYGPSVDRRRSERFTCTPQANQIRCVIRSSRADGRQLTGQFTAKLDGTGAPVTGIPDVDEVQLRRPSNTLLDATFLSRGRPAFGYRAFQSQDRRSLMIVTVDPVTHAALTTVVVYDRR